MNDNETPRDADALEAWHPLDALLDGEPVDRRNLLVVLEEAEAREYLVDALVMRRWTQQLGPAKFVSPEAPRRGSPFRWVAAAMLVVTSLATGYTYGGQQDGSSSIEVTVNVGAVPAPPPAPEPTQAIKFEPGVNWETTTGRP